MKALSLHREKQAFREQPLLVNPLRFATKTGGIRELRQFSYRILMAALCPNRFTFREPNHQFRA